MGIADGLPTILSDLRSLKLCSLAGCLVLALAASTAEGGGPGLDQRPSNTTCLAGPRPFDPSAAQLVRAFPNVRFGGQVTGLARIPGDGTRWFVAERNGLVFSFANQDQVQSKERVLDLRARIGSQGEGQWGLMSLAFREVVAGDGKPLTELYATFTIPADEIVGRSRTSYLSRFTSRNGGALFDLASEEVLVSQVQTGVTHDIGHVAFGPDGLLYLSFGDGYSRDSAQDPDDLRGKILRLDVDRALGAAPQVHALGFRNPWRFSFDRFTGDLWVGDVGLANWEEVSRVEPGTNHGWPIMEGAQCVKGAECVRTGLTLPTLAYSHDEGCSVIGGISYRGSEFPGLQGSYLFADWCAGQVWSLEYDDQGTPFKEPLATVPNNERPVAFAEDLNGEAYLAADHYLLRLSAATSTEAAGGAARRLSETGCVDPGNPTLPAPGVIPYSINTALWSDGAHKERWVAMPDGEQVGILGDGDLHFPRGTVLMKTFRLSGRPVETRLFMRHDNGTWAGYSYEWNQDLTDAVLLAGLKRKVLPDGTRWTFPSRAQCLQCHTAAAGFTLGPEIGQLNREEYYPASGLHGNQLATWDHIGLFKERLASAPEHLPALAAVNDHSRGLESRARSYLHANCSGCHRPGGSTQVGMDLRFATPIDETVVCDQAPGAGDLGVPDARLLAPGDPARSVLALRIHALDGNRMPPLGTERVDIGGAGMIEQWIESRTHCGPPPDRDQDRVPDSEDNCPDVPNNAQFDGDLNAVGDACQHGVPSLRGKPDYRSGIDDGVFLWKYRFDDLYRLRVSGDGEGAEFLVQVIADRPLSSVAPIDLDRGEGDSLEVLPGAFSLRVRVDSEVDGVNFEVPRNASAMISVRRLGLPDPQRLRIGKGGHVPAPAGWILDSNELTPLPASWKAGPFGLYLGLAGPPNELAVRWKGDEWVHRYALSVLSSAPFLNVWGSSIERDDDLEIGQRAVELSGALGRWWDGLGLRLDPGARLAIAPTEDGDFRPEVVNPTSGHLPFPDAYRLPVPSTLGKPIYNPAKDGGLFIWRETSGTWQVRVTAGGKVRQYLGTIVSSGAIGELVPVATESGDRVHLDELGRTVSFKLWVHKASEEGFSFSPKPGSGLTLTLGAGGPDDAELIRVGSDRWRVFRLPVEVGYR